MQFIEPFANITAKFFAQLEQNLNTNLIREILNKLIIETQNGNSYIKLDQNELNQLTKYQNIIKNNQLAPLVIIDQNKLTIGKIWYMEKQIANFLKSKINHNYTINNINNLLNENVLNKLHLIIITGPPGTGKTFNVAKIINILLQNNTSNLKIAIAAPTGKAAINMEMSIKKQSKIELNYLKGETLHKLLNINPFSLKSYKQQENKSYDLIIIDEASMIDINSMYLLTKLINDKTKLILLGDPNQLPPVGGTNLLSIITKNHNLQNNIINLTKNYRYKENSPIAKLAKLCLEKNSNQKIINCFSQNNQNLKIINNLKPNQLILKWYQDNHNYWKNIKNNNKINAFKSLSNQILLCVLKKDSDKFNKLYLNLIKIKQNIPINKNIFSGVPIIITQNNYNLNLYNGDIGITFEENNKIYVYFYTYHNNQFKKFNINELNNYDLAFCLTVHKSQGCEYNHVTLMEPNYYYNNNENIIDENIINIFDKKMIYTAITRAKETFTYIGNINNFINAISNLNIKNSAINFFLKN